MRFGGAWISRLQDGVKVEFASFDETDLTEASNWTEAHQNVDPEFPAGYVDPARIVAEAGRKLLEARPEFRAESGDGPVEIRTLEDYGRLCLGMSEWIATMASARAVRSGGRGIDGTAEEEIAF